MTKFRFIGEKGIKVSLPVPDRVKNQMYHQDGKYTWNNSSIIRLTSVLVKHCFKCVCVYRQDPQSWGCMAPSDVTSMRHPSLMTGQTRNRKYHRRVNTIITNIKARFYDIFSFPYASLITAKLNYHLLNKLGDISNNALQETI